MTRRSSRRDFLRGRAAVDALGDAAAQSAAEPTDPGNASATGGYTVQVGRHAMACQFEICLDAARYPAGTEAAIDALDLVESLEEQLSFFRSGSQISRLNLLAAQEPVEVDSRLFNLLSFALQISRETEGALDLTATPLWELWGFARRAGAMPPEDKIDEAKRLVGSHLVELDAAHKTVHFLRPGVRLNLGAVGKGYAVDCCTEKLLSDGIEHFLVSGGYSSMVARGLPSESAGGMPGWSVGIRNPLRPDRRLAELRLCNRALGTSGSYMLAFRFEGKSYGHILDPRSGRPAEGVLSATVVAPNAMLADALSTAFYVLGLEKTREYCRTRPQIGAVLICPIRRQGGVEIHPINLSAAELTLCGESAVG